jgi:hypothetical protein
MHKQSEAILASKQLLNLLQSWLTKSIILHKFAKTIS